METVLVGIDGSKSAHAAAEWTAAHAEQTGARVVAVFAVPRSELWSLSALQVDIDKVLADFRACLDGEWTAHLRKPGLTVNTRLVRGDPATELLHAAETAGATMIILGSTRHRSDIAVGGTVHKLINRSPLPVVLVPAS
jgi:nucleotide-binding universal stress UspA family protein